MNKENIILEFMKDENYTPMKAKEIAILLGVPKKECLWEYQKMSIITF